MRAGGQFTLTNHRYENVLIVPSYLSRNRDVKWSSRTIYSSMYYLRGCLVFRSYFCILEYVVLVLSPSLIFGKPFHFWDFLISSLSLGILCYYPCPRRAFSLTWRQRSGYFTNFALLLLDRYRRKRWVCPSDNEI